jgi:hypothetical protein
MYNKNASKATKTEVNESARYYRDVPKVEREENLSENDVSDPDSKHEVLGRCSVTG